MSYSARCHYCGLWTGEVVGGPDNPWGGSDVHGHCRDAARYAAALSRVRAMDDPPRPRAHRNGRHMLRAMWRVGLERHLEVVTGLART